MWWLVGILYSTAWLIAAWRYLPRPVLFAMAIPISLSIITTITDEGAEVGRDGFRGDVVVRKGSVNVHWGLLAFYLAAARGILTPNTSPQMRDGALVLLFVSFALGLIATFTIKVKPYVPPIAAAISLLIVLLFGKSIRIP